MNYNVTTIDRSLNFEKELSTLSKQTWPEFLHHADDYHWGELSKSFARFQLLFVSGSDLLGVGHTVPLHWNQDKNNLPNTVDEIIISAIKCRDLNKSSNTLAALAVMVSQPYRGKGLSTKILTAMKLLAGEYIVEGALQPIIINRAKNVGRYEDPNVWMLHKL